MAPEVVAVFARWWDNFQESCDIRLAVGCGCAVAWVLLVAISPMISTTSTFIEGGLTWRSGIVIGSLLAFAAAAISCRRRVCPRWDGERAPAIPLLAAAAVLSPVGAVLHQGIAGGVLAVIAGLFVGCGLSALVLGWAAPFSAVRLRKRVVATVASLFVGGALYLAIAPLPAPLSFALALTLAPASLFLAMVIARVPTQGEAVGASLEPASAAADTQNGGGDGGGGTGAGGGECGTGDPRPSSHAGPKGCPSPARLFGPELSLAVIIYGALFVLAGHVLPEIEIAWMTSILPGLANVSALLASETVLTVYLVKRSRIESPRAAFRPATILIAAGIALLPFVGDAGAIPCMAVAFAGFGCFLVYFWIVMGNMAQRWNTTPLPLCAFGFLLLLSGIAFGELATWILYRLPVDFGYPAAVSVVSLFLLVMLAWNMTDGSRYAQETTAMGGIPFGSENRGLGFGDTGDELEPGAPADATDAKLRAAAETYGLSPREVEVVALLLRGRSIPYICDELFIAKSTAQTHVRHIYAKMDITGGRQELIDRLESAECS